VFRTIDWHWGPNPEAYYTPEMPYIAAFVATGSAVLANIIVTSLILIRLIRARRKFSKALGPEGYDNAIYDSTVSIIVESSAPLAAFGVCVLATTAAAVAEQRKNTVGYDDPATVLLVAALSAANTVAGLLYASFCVRYHYSFRRLI